MKRRFFLGGRTTAPEVDKLMDLPVAKGSAITFRQIEDTIGVQPTPGRMRSVVDAWKRRLFRERGMQTIIESGAVRILTDAEALAHGNKSINHAGRAIGRAVKRIDYIDTTALTPAQKDQHTLLRRHAFAAASAVRDACIAIAPPRPVATTLRLAKTGDE